VYEYHRVKSNISVCGRNIQHNNSKVDDVHLDMKNLPDSSDYWGTVINELIAQIRCFGPPQYFITFSCNDLNWLDVRKALLLADGDVERDLASLTIYETQIFIEKYLTAISRHFMIRVNALITHMKSNHEFLGSHIMDYWWHIEFQDWGSPHLHNVIWV